MKKIFPSTQIIAVIFALISLLSAGSCTHKADANATLGKIALDGFRSANKNISDNNRALLQSLEENLKDSRTHERSLLWQPKITQIEHECRAFLFFLDSIRAKPVDSNWLEMYAKLTHLRTSLLALDSSITMEFKNGIVALPGLFDSLTKASINIPEYFNEASASNKQLFLAKTQNDVLIQENHLLEFCLNQTRYRSDNYYSLFSIIVGQNTTHLKAGEELEINAGIGAFSRNASPRFKIRGKIIPLNNDALVNYKEKVFGERGAHTIPVEVEFIDESGLPMKKTYQIKYFIDN